MVQIQVVLERRRNEVIVPGHHLSGILRLTVTPCFVTMDSDIPVLTIRDAIYRDGISVLEMKSSCLG